MKKGLEVAVIPQPSVANLVPGLAPNPNWSCDIYVTLLLIGLITAPPWHSGFHLSAFWAWLRYASVFERQGNALRLRRAWKDVDPHQKTILADDFGMGFTCHYLVEKFCFEGFGNTRQVLDVMFGPQQGYVKVAQNGAAKSPDFIAIDAADNLHILECKGSQVSRKAVAAAMAVGVKQKTNVQHHSQFASCMVGGMYIPLHDSKEDALLSYQDPSPDARLAKINARNMPAVGRVIRRISFAKTLVAAGLLRSATTIAGGELHVTDLQFISELESGELGFLGFVRHSDSQWRKTVEHRAFEPASEEGSPDGVAMQATLRIDIPHDIVELFRAVVSRYGRVDVERIDAWLASKRSARRNEPGPGSPDSNGSDTCVHSAWSWTELAEYHSAVTTPEGITFALSQTPYVQR